MKFSVGDILVYSDRKIDEYNNISFFNEYDRKSYRARKWRVILINENSGIIRVELIARLPSDIHCQIISNYFQADMSYIFKIFEPKKPIIKPYYHPLTSMFSRNDTIKTPS